MFPHAPEAVAHADGVSHPRDDGDHRNAGSDAVRHTPDVIGGDGSKKQCQRERHNHSADRDEKSIAQRVEYLAQHRTVGLYRLAEVARNCTMSSAMGLEVPTEPDGQPRWSQPRPPASKTPLDRPLRA